MNWLSMFGGFLVGAATVYGVFQWSDGDHDFKQLGVEAALLDGRGLVLSFPEDYVQDPSSFVLEVQTTPAGQNSAIRDSTVVYLDGIEGEPLPGKKTFELGTLEFIRHTVCEQIGEDGCDSIVVRGMRITAEFSRGGRSDFIDEISEFDFPT